jgi:hypothetical protein
VGRVHEVEVETAQKQECEIAVRDDGTVHYVECVIPYAEAPEAIRAAAAALVPGGEPLETEHKTGTGVDEVSLELKAADGLHHLRFKASGELLVHARRLSASVDVPVR